MWKQVRREISRRAVRNVNDCFFLFTFCFSYTFRAKISTLNVRGFGSQAKQFSVFEYAGNTKSDFIFLQEALVSKFESIRDFQSRWSGPSCHFCSGKYSF